jgi:hypothetical protein
MSTISRSARLVDIPRRFAELERVRIAILMAVRDGDDALRGLLHEANNLSTMAYSWAHLADDGRKTINLRIERLIVSWVARERAGC